MWLHVRQLFFSTDHGPINADITSTNIVICESVREFTAMKDDIQEEENDL